MHHSLPEAKCDTVQDDIDKVIARHRGIDMESIDIVQVFLDSTCLLEITDLIESLVRLTVVAIVFPNGVFDLFPSSIPMLVSCPPF